jgi:hypothetical protein
LIANENNAPPRVDWWYGQVTHEEPTGGEGNIFTEYQELAVRVWNTGADLDTAETNTRILKNNLLVALREVSLKSFSGGLRVGSFNWSEEQHEHFGRWLEGTVEIPLPVPARAQEYVTIEQVGFKGIALLTDEETVCEDNFDDPPP